MKNPFNYGTNVIDEGIFGRTKEIDALLKTVKLGESAVLRAPNGLGKSTLLAEIVRKNSKDYIFVPIDLTGIADELALVDSITRETMRAAYGSVETFPPEAWDMLTNPALRRSVVEGIKSISRTRYGKKAITLSAQKLVQLESEPNKPETMMDIRMCPWCGTPLKWVDRYSRHYCYKCKKYAPVRRTVRLPMSTTGVLPLDEMRCPKCQHDLKFVHKYSEFYCDKCKRYPMIDSSRRPRDRPTMADIVEALDLPERVANQKVNRVVVIFDEFQEIATIENPIVLETMRQRCEMHANVSYIFAGSNKQFFSRMFQEKGGPFHNFAQWVELGPIPEELLERFLIETFADGKGKLKKEAADIIVGVSGGYPSHAQKIAHVLFDISPSPSIKQAEEAVSTVVRQQAPLYSAIWESVRSPLHRRYLLALAIEPRVAHGEDFVRRHGLRSRSHVQRTEKQLEMKGLICDGEIVDPMFVLWLRSTAYA